MNLAKKLFHSLKIGPQFQVLTGAKAPPPEADLTVSRDAFGRMRRELVWTLGETRAHGFMARLGFSCGQFDYFNKKDNETILSKISDLKKIEASPDAQEFILEASDSCEAKEHLRFFQPPIKHPQCWFLAGYLTGYFSNKIGSPVYFLEMQCRAKKDSCCRFIGKRRDAWTPEFELSLSAYQEDNMAQELADTRKQLKLTKDRYQNLFEQSSVPILIIDPTTGGLLDANIAVEELAGFSQEELLEMTLFDLCPSEDHHNVADHLRAILGNESIKQREMRLVRKDGERLTIAYSGKAMAFGGDQVIQIIMRDITDLKDSEQKEKDLHSQLIQSERLSSIGRLAAGVAHELKNPLGAIRNAIYYIQNALTNHSILETDPHLKKILKLAESEVDSSVSIIGELLDFSRAVQLTPRQTQINNLLEMLPTIISIPEGIRFHFDLDLTLPTAQVDPERLTQVFCNIINNAVQSMPEGGELTIRSWREVETTKEGKTEQAAIAIQDTGRGIEPVHLRKIFEPLFTTKARGTGLGLAISSNIIEKHGGVIQVSSQAGKGTTFTIKLPFKPLAEKEI